MAYFLDLAPAGPGTIFETVLGSPLFGALFLFTNPAAAGVWPGTPGPRPDPGRRRDGVQISGPHGGPILHTNPAAAGSWPRPGGPRPNPSRRKGGVQKSDPYL
jgi:hypothetical protein